MSCLQTFCMSVILHDHNKNLTETIEGNKVEDFSHNLQIAEKEDFPDISWRHG